MPDLSVAIVPALVLGVAIVMLVAEMRSWRAAKRGTLSDRDRAFRWRRLRRRTQAAVMLAGVGVLMLVGHPEMKLLGEKPSVYVATGIWVTVFLLLLWIVLLALADAMASLQRTQQLRQDLSVEQAMLQAEIRRQQTKPPADDGHATKRLPEDADTNEA